MEQTLIQLIQEGLSCKQIAAKLSVSYGSVKYQLKKYNLKTSYTQKNKTKSYEELEESNCFKCKNTKPISQFHKVWKGTKFKPRPYCIECDNELVRTNRSIRSKSLKEFSVEYIGGKCIVCSYNRCNKALEFHHSNSEQKEFTISKLINKAVTASSQDLGLLKSELDKCVLLCCRCHREFHAGVISLPNVP